MKSVSDLVTEALLVIITTYKYTEHILCARYIEDFTVDFQNCPANEEALAPFFCF